MEKKLQGTIDKRTELLSVKYNQSIEGGKGLFEFSSRNESAARSTTKNQTPSSNCDEDSHIAEPAFSRESSLETRGRQFTPQKSSAKLRDSSSKFIIISP